MIKNLILTSFRSLGKNKFFSTLNILGLAIGMSVFLLIAQYVKFETSYEDFITNADNIYRVRLDTYINNELIISSAENYPGAGPAMKDEFPEVQSYARLYNMGYKNNLIVTYEDSKPDPIAFKHRRFLYADSAFLPMMKFEMESGDATHALAEPNTCVLSSSYARRYFGDENPIGKILHMQDDDGNNELATVTGVFRDIPTNTHLKFDLLYSYKTLFGRYKNAERAIARYDQSWQRSDMYTFIQLRDGTNPIDVERKIPDLINKYSPGLAEKNQRDEMSLQPIKSIHLTSNLANEPETNGNERIVAFLGIIGIFVLIIAWINYINLSTAKAMERAKEVGVRKVMGAFKQQLVNQFLMEAGVVNLVALLISILLVILALPYFNQLAGLSLEISYLLQSWFVLLVAALWIIGTMLSGFYPSLVLSSFKPVTVLKGKIKNSVSGILLRKSLVVLQFTASIALIAGTFIVYNQLNFMMNQDLGFNIDQVLVLDRPGIAPRESEAFNSSIDVFRNELKSEPSIVSVSTSITVPGKQREYKTQIKKHGAPDDQLVTVRVNSMDDDFVDVFKMDLLAGRAFSQNYPNDPDTSAILTESAVKLLGFEKPEDAIGQTVAIPGFFGSLIVVGVVNDYHQVSLKTSLDPTLFFCSRYFGEFYSIRMKTNNLTSTINHVKASWEKAFPGNPFDYFFLDDFFNRQYQNEKTFGELFGTFATLAVVVGCLGLFGLSAYTASQRTKEIGVRKVLGSSEQGIFFLLSKEYLKLIGIAIVLAVPSIYWVMNNWLQTFPYQSSISVWVFFLAGGIVLTVALLTVSFQTLKASRTNPVVALRYE
ncbi:MAG: ABC transporter permease [Cyclobacteriaceae bacterium]|nr:ABC transporter permease [Cyclobacteriaceae bacterium]